MRGHGDAEAAVLRGGLGDDGVAQARQRRPGGVGEDERGGRDAVAAQEQGQRKSDV